MPNSQLEIAGAELVRRLGGHWTGDRGMCLCPAHDDHMPSLSVRVGKGREGKRSVRQVA